MCSASDAMTWARRITEQAEREAQREQRFADRCTPSKTRGTYAGGTSGAAVEKEEAVRSETYRRLVAAMPCKMCGIWGFSQAAHPNTGKGAGLKTDDRLCFPLCGPRPDAAGCHALFDQGALYPKEVRRALEPAWGADTRRFILAAGTWPARLPRWEEA